MEFRKMAMMTLYTRQQKRHRCVERTFGLRGRRRGWDDLGEWHWNMYTIMKDSNRQSMSDEGYSMLGAGACGWPRGMLWGGRWEGGSCLWTHVHPWWIHVNVWQNHYSIVKQIKVKIKIKKKINKKQRHYFANKSPSSQGYGFANSHIWMDVRVGL